jgi:hypothetical protein
MDCNHRAAFKGADFVRLGWVVVWSEQLNPTIRIGQNKPNLTSEKQGSPF